MAFYRLGSMAPATGFAPTFERPVICERCQQILGKVLAVQTLIGVPPQIAARIWPELEATIRQHEDECCLTAHVR